MKNLYLICLSALVLVACEDSRHFNAQPESTSLADFAPAMNQKVVVQPASAQAGNVRDVATDGYKGADPAGVYLAYRYGSASSCHLPLSNRLQINTCKSAAMQGQANAKSQAPTRIIIPMKIFARICPCELNQNGWRALSRI